jgi:hypothetical protein
VAHRHRQHQYGADASSLDRLSKQAKQFHIEVPIQIDVRMQDTSRHIEDLVSPQLCQVQMTNRRLTINGIFRVSEINETSDITRFRLEPCSYWPGLPATDHREKRQLRNSV